MANKIYGKTIAATYKKLLFTKDNNGLNGASAGSERIICTDDGDGVDSGITESCLAVGTARVGIREASPAAALSVGAGSDALVEAPGGENVSTEGINLVIADSGNYCMGIQNTSPSGNGLLIKAGDHVTTDWALRVVDYNGGTEGLCVTGGGRVGIGRTDPDYKLAISSTSYSLLHLTRTSSTANVDIKFTNDEGDMYAGMTHKSDTLMFGIGSNADQGTYAKFVVEASGNVGIGTTAPDNPLQVESDTEGTGSGNVTCQASFGKNGEGEVQIGTHDGMPSISGQGSSSNYRLLLNPENGGNVGIGTGTDAPLSPLTVSTTNVGSADASANSMVAFHRTDSGNPTHGRTLLIGAKDNGAVWLQSHQQTSFAVDTDLALNPEGGKVGIGTSTPTYTLDVEGTSTSWLTEMLNTSTSTSADCLKLQINASSETLTGDGWWVGCYDASGIEGGIRGVGGNGVDFESSSDRRLKDNIVDIPDALSIISSLKPRNFYWKSQSELSNKPMQYGFIADEYEEVFPGTVNGKRDADGKLISNAVKEDGSIFKQLIDGNKFTVPVLVKAIQELSDKVTALENA